MNGTSQPSGRAASAMAWSSVDRMSRSNAPEICAVSTEYAISGLPARSFTFFRGIPFEPPRAVMTPRTFIT